MIAAAWRSVIDHVALAGIGWLQVPRNAVEVAVGFVVDHPLEMTWVAVAFLYAWRFISPRS